jgi:prepilin-type N-terminal cleavage/methylation domain-containing protein
MKLTNQKGFTLIELIMVIVILGILAAVVVPKFFDFTGKAHE